MYADDKQRPRSLSPSMIPSTTEPAPKRRKDDASRSTGNCGVDSTPSSAFHGEDQGLSGSRIIQGATTAKPLGVPLPPPPRVDSAYNPLTAEEHFSERKTIFNNFVRLEKWAGSVDDEISPLQDEVARMGKEMKELEMMVAAMQKENKTIQRENEGLKWRVETLEAKMQRGQSPALEPQDGSVTGGDAVGRTESVD